MKTLLFDLDGTLIDTTDLILRCFAHSWETVCGRTHGREALIDTFGIPLREAMRRLLGAPAVEAVSVAEAESAATVERLIGEYRSFNLRHHDLLIRPFADIGRVVAELKERGYRIGVVTSKSRELGWRGLRVCGLDGLVDEAVFMEDTERHKPDPAPIMEALARLGERPACAAYIGDSRHDLRAGRAAGVCTVAALWGPLPRPELERERPDFLAETPAGLLKIFPRPAPC